MAEPTFRSTYIDTSASKVVLSKADLIVFPFLVSSIIVADGLSHFLKAVEASGSGRSRMQVAQVHSVVRITHSLHGNVCDSLSLNARVRQRFEEELLSGFQLLRGRSDG